ncbi:MAG TPA: zf-HC2 domain-containing protein [Longimicrobium sp.]|nr:zf-HC2 domain-containing protein [Longimicrobium sp.]
MTHDRVLELLDDYVGGELPPAEERDVRRHLMACEECRREESALRSLLQAAAELPAEIGPPRDLWADIAARLEPRTDDDIAPEIRTIGPRTRRIPPWWLQAAAAVLLVATTALVTARVTGARGGAPLAQVPAQQAVQPGGRPATALVAFSPAEREYRTAIGQMETLLATQRDKLAPQTVATLEANLRVIDQAIRESRAALEQDPNSPELARMLSEAYDAKLDVLERAVRL